MGVQKALRLMTEWSYFLHNAPAQCDNEMFTAYPDLIAYAKCQDLVA
jgi:hypothetical protein